MVSEVAVAAVRGSVVVAVAAFGGVALGFRVSGVGVRLVGGTVAELPSLTPWA